MWFLWHVMFQLQSRNSSLFLCICTSVSVCVCVCLQSTLNEPRQCAACGTLLPWLRSTRSPERALWRAARRHSFAIKTISCDKCFDNNAACWRLEAFQHPEPHAVTPLSATAVRAGRVAEIKKHVHSPATWILLKYVPNARRQNVNWISH